MTTKPKPPTKGRRRSAPRERSGGKTREAPRPARQGKGGRYSDEQRAEALRLVEEQGTAHAHKVTGVPKPTLSRWAKDAGIDTEASAARRTAAATEAVRARAAEVRLSTVELLEQHVAQAGDYVATIAGVNALAARLIVEGKVEDLVEVSTMAGPIILPGDQHQAAELVKIARALERLPFAPRDAEGVLTRAIHDLQLLKGEATERGELMVEFAVPRPTPPDPASVVEVPSDEE